MDTITQLKNKERDLIKLIEKRKRLLEQAEESLLLIQKKIKEEEFLSEPLKPTENTLLGATRKKGK